MDHACNYMGNIKEHMDKEQWEEMNMYISGRYNIS